MMRWVFMFLVLGGCGVQGDLAFTAANLAMVPVIGRTVPDLVFSLATGRDCSMVRLEQGKTWCREAEGPVAAPAFCTRSLGTVDCWESAALQPLPARRGVAEGPRVVTAGGTSGGSGP